MPQHLRPLSVPHRPSSHSRPPRLKSLGRLHFAGHDLGVPIDRPPPFPRRCDESARRASEISCYAPSNTQTVKSTQPPSFPYLLHFKLVIGVYLSHAGGLLSCARQRAVGA